MSNKKLTASMLGLALAGGVGAGAVGLVRADNIISSTSTTSNTSTTAPTIQGPGFGRHGGPGVHGTVSSVSGTTFTVTDTKGTAYTINASGAKVQKSTSSTTQPTTATVSDVAVGDTVMVRGTVSGTTVTATDIMDGAFPTRGPPGGLEGKGGGFGGRGGEGTMGTVTAINGSTITLTGKDGGTYTIDATSATVKKGSLISHTAPADSSLSSIAVGDTLMIRGKVVTASLTAQSIVDGTVNGN